MSAVAQRTADYSSAIFNVGDIRSAKNIILTPDSSLGTDARWQKETPYLVDLIASRHTLDQNSLVLDFGCGIGRMSKALIERFNCFVVGVDISTNMRALAPTYVQSDRFMTCHPSSLHVLNLKFELTVAVWVLQHCRDVQEDVANIHYFMAKYGKLFIVNDERRIVPTTIGWVNDGKDLKEILKAQFMGKPVNTNPLDVEQVGAAVAGSSYWAMMER